VSKIGRRNVKNIQFVDKKKLNFILRLCLILLTFQVFLGGAVLADIMKNNPDFWITKAEYEEKGIRCLDKLSGPS
jgi:hypothetical protein